MAIKVYGLTSKGLMLAKNYRLPDEPKYKVLSSLYKLTRADLLSICEDTGFDQRTVLKAIRDLRGLVGEE
jgi:hypothetical protein